MVQCSPGALDRIFGALADPTRRAILARLAAGDASVMELATPCDMSVPAVAKHLRVLADAGLVASEKTGRVRQCRLDARPLRSAAEWLQCYTQFWNHQLDHLGDLLEAADAKEKRWSTTSRPRKPSSRSRAPIARRKPASSRR
jgi:DNA-binding transcriptional ArsR family regulator